MAKTSAAANTRSVAKTRALSKTHALAKPRSVAQAASLLPRLRALAAAAKGDLNKQLLLRLAALATEAHAAPYHAELDAIGTRAAAGNYASAAAFLRDIGQIAEEARATHGGRAAATQQARALAERALALVVQTAVA